MHRRSGAEFVTTINLWAIIMTHEINGILNFFSISKELVDHIRLEISCMAVYSLARSSTLTCGLGFELADDDGDTAVPVAGVVAVVAAGEVWTEEEDEGPLPAAEEEEEGASVLTADTRAEEDAATGGDDAVAATAVIVVAVESTVVTGFAIVVVVAFWLEEVVPLLSLTCPFTWVGNTC